MKHRYSIDFIGEGSRGGFVWLNEEEATIVERVLCPDYWEDFYEDDYSPVCIFQKMDPMTAREAAERILKGMLEMKDYYDGEACDRESDCIAVLAAGLKSAIDEGIYGE